MCPHLDNHFIKLENSNQKTHWFWTEVNLITLKSLIIYLYSKDNGWADILIHHLGFNFYGATKTEICWHLKYLVLISTRNFNLTSVFLWKKRKLIVHSFNYLGLRFRVLEFSLSNWRNHNLKISYVTNNSAIGFFTHSPIFHWVRSGNDRSIGGRPQRSSSNTIPRLKMSLLFVNCWVLLYLVNIKNTINHVFCIYIYKSYWYDLTITCFEIQLQSNQ
jgi:hypothetical protein